MKKKKTLEMRREAFRTSRSMCRHVNGNSKQRRRIKRLAKFYEFM